MPLKKADNPIDQWNRFKLMVQNNEGTVWLNDELIIDKARKKFNREYPIGLQDHGTVVWFKSIFVKELPERESTGQSIRQIVRRDVTCCLKKNYMAHGLFTERKGRLLASF